MPAKRFWIFTLSFWLIAGTLVFVNALAIDHWNRVAMRFMYFPILGVLIVSAKTLVYDSAAYRRLRHPLLAVLGLSAAGALITAIILNPITYLLLGLDLRENHIQRMLTGALQFSLFYLLWSVLYLELDGRPVLGDSTGSGEHLDHLEVDDRGESLRIPVTDIEWLAAAGDYVEIHVKDRRYLKKATISSLESLLDPRVFRRIHRSTIVNSRRVTRINGGGGGTFELTLDSGRVVTASRSFRSVVEELQGQR